MSEENKKEVPSSDLYNIIMKVPRETIRLELTAHVYSPEGVVEKYNTTLNMDEIRDARTDFLDNVEFGDDYDAVYMLSEKAQRMFDDLKDKTQEDGEFPDD